MAALVALHAGDAAARRPDIPERPLDEALIDLSARFATPILFDKTLVRARRAHAVGSLGTFDRTLAETLRGTGLTYSRTSAGIYTITVERAEVAQKTEKEPPAPASSQSISDILVTGRTTENVGIRRGNDDIQPYIVLGAERVAATQNHTAGSLLFEQLTMNTPTPYNLSVFNNNFFGSIVDLNGLGTDQTLVTVDGRRLPGVPAGGTFPQPNVLALAPSAIERIETLGTTAGAIYGADATGGSVNLVLKRDYRGFEIGVTNGISDRGDAANRTFEAKAGFATADGRTKGMIRVGFSEDDGALEGSRDRRVKQREIASQAYPDYALFPSREIQVRSLDGSNLRLSSQYGGASLTSAYTQVPLNAAALGSGGLAQLQANAGKQDLELSPDGQGAQQTLTPNAQNLSIIYSLRQEIGSRFEIFADGLLLRSVGHYQTAAIDTRGTVLEPGEGGNPFDQAISVTYPTPGLVGHLTDSQQIDRETLGFIAKLWKDWSASADISRGGATFNVRQTGAYVNPADLDFFAGGAAFASQLAGVSQGEQLRVHGFDRMYDINARAAGSVFHLPGGPMTVTVTGEWHSDRQPGLTAVNQNPTTGVLEPVFTGRQRQSMLSGFAEARLPLLSTETRLFPLRGLNLQLAVRHDAYRIIIPTLDGTTQVGPEILNKGAVTSFTGGASVNPIDGVMLRASFSDGYELPTPDEITPGSYTLSLEDISDPRRGGDAHPETGDVAQTFGGRPDQRAQKAKTISVGTVLRPRFIDGLRLSVDVSRLEITRQIDGMSPSPQYIIDNEASYPGRVVRAPLTAADAAMGYTAGRIIAIDTTLLSDQHSVLTSLNASVDYRHRALGGALHVFGQATWQSRYRIYSHRGAAAYDVGNTAVGPIRLRAQMGAEWASGPVSLGLDTQYYGAFRTTYLVGDQGRPVAGEIGFSQELRPRTYLDATIGYRSDVRVLGRKASITYRLGVRNMFDLQPSPLASLVVPAVSNPYSDVIGRRFEFKAVCQF